MSDTDFINNLELIGSMAWPALVTSKLFGWLLRADKGVTRRANSVLPIAFSGTNLDSMIDEVEAFYTRRGLPVYFQMTSASQPPELDETLQNRGFAKELEVHVQTADIDTVLQTKTTLESQTLSVPDATWSSCYARSAGYSQEVLETRLNIMARAKDKCAYSIAFVDGAPASVGFGVVTDHWLGLFGIVTHPDFRRRGAATAVNVALAEWGKAQGATDVYLQVEIDNEPALKLYERSGFSTTYTYWYRLLKK